MALNRTALRRYTQWLPLLVLVGVCIVWWSPLGVVTGLATSVAVVVVLQRFQLIGDAAGGATLRSQPLQSFAAAPPSHDVLLQWAELGMGGPIYSTQMLRDGAIVHDIATSGSQSGGTDWCDLAGTSLRLTDAWIDRCLTVVVYDEKRKVLTHLSDIRPEVFWHALGECRQQYDDRAAENWVRRLPGEGTPLQPYHGLWLAPDAPALADPPQRTLRHVLPDGRILQATLLLPDDLRLTVDPALFCMVRPYALQLDGVDSGRHVCDLERVVVSENGRCLAVGGSVLGANLRPQCGVWLIHRDGHWQAINTQARSGVGASSECVWVDVRATCDDGTLECEAYQYRWDKGTMRRQPTTHVTLDLAVEWRETALSVRLRNGRFTVRVPRR